MIFGANDNSLIFVNVICSIAYKDLESTTPDGYHKQMITYRPQDKDWDVSLILSTGVCERQV